MIRKLKELLTLFLSWVNKIFNRKKISSNLPNTIAESERIARSIFSTINIDKKKGTLKPNAFRTPSGKDEISVNRLDYTTADFCKSEAKRNEMPASDRNYFGLAILYKHEITDFNFQVVYTPILTPPEQANPYHADIKIGFIPEKGKELPIELSHKINTLTKIARFYKDPTPHTDSWNGGNLV
ncbi:MAG: hypothetical protein WDM90_20635 [Ferruginibacter sp.]